IALQYPSLEFFDVGGGLAVDYDGTMSKSDSSMNYTVEEYARNVVAVIGNACLEANIPDPTIITESGRSLVSHHSAFIVELIDVISHGQVEKDSHLVSAHPVLESLSSMLTELSEDNCRELFHDTIELKARSG